MSIIPQAKRLTQLGDVFIQIDWLHTELAMDPPDYSDTPPGPVASSSTLAVPSFPLTRPSSSCGMRSTINGSNTDPFLTSTIGLATPTPLSQSKPDGGLLYPTSSPPPVAPMSPSELSSDPVREYHRALSRFVQLLDSAPSDPVPATLLGSFGVEPTQGILIWAEKLCMDLEETKRRRETHIQAMYDQLEALWRRMGVDDEAMDGFVEVCLLSCPGYY